MRIVPSLTIQFIALWFCIVPVFGYPSNYTELTKYLSELPTVPIVSLNTIKFEPRDGCINHVLAVNGTSDVYVRYCGADRDVHMFVAKTEKRALFQSLIKCGVSLAAREDFFDVRALFIPREERLSVTQIATLIKENKESQFGSVCVTPHCVLKVRLLGLDRDRYVFCPAEITNDIVAELVERRVPIIYERVNPCDTLNVGLGLFVPTLFALLLLGTIFVHRGKPR
ncbi:MAG TPA: hypothetical protein V6C86_22945 [Oculatellaceae cyanobacterium]